MATLKSLQGSKLEADVEDINSLKDIEADSLGDTVADEDGSIYRFVQFTDQDVSAGDVVQLASLSFDADGEISELKVTNDQAGGSALARTGFGVAVASVTGSNDNYGWVQVSGPVEGVNVTSTSVSAGDYLIASQANDGEAAAMTDGEEEEVIGICTEDNSSTCVAVLRTL